MDHNEYPTCDVFIAKFFFSDWKGQLDMLVKTPVQRIPGNISEVWSLSFCVQLILGHAGKKTFGVLHLDGHSAVGRFVDGVDLSLLAEFMRRRRTPVMNGTHIASLVLWVRPQRLFDCSRNVDVYGQSCVRRQGDRHGPGQ